jgi:hypothetical protein
MGMVGTDVLATYYIAKLKQQNVQPVLLGIFRASQLWQNQLTLGRKAKSMLCYATVLARELRAVCSYCAEAAYKSLSS